MNLTILIFLLGGFGALLRYSLDRFLHELNALFPISTLFINVLGSLLIGVIYVLGMDKGIISKELSLVLSVGFLGGFTTFSAFSLQTVLLMKSSSATLAGVYFFLCPIASVAAAYTAITVTRTWF